MASYPHFTGWMPQHELDECHILQNIIFWETWRVQLCAAMNNVLLYRSLSMLLKMGDFLALSSFLNVFRKLEISYNFRNMPNLQARVLVPINNWKYTHYCLTELPRKYQRVKCFFSLLEQKSENGMVSQNLLQSLKAIYKVCKNVIHNIIN